MLKFCLFFHLILSVLCRVTEGEDAEVSCVPLENCVLPCSFRGTDPVIHWTKEPHDKTSVHSYFYGQNQLQFQHQNFTGRTSLFEEELSTGNASLLLSEVRGQDEGTYRCYTSPIDGVIKESYVSVKVHAPVLEVSLQQEAEQLLCRSEGLLHKPSVSWRNRTEPLQKNQSQTGPSESGGGVWSVLSSVSLPHKPPHEYSCNVSTPHSWRSATYRRSTLSSSTGSDVTFLCSSPRGEVKSLVWTFNQTQTILNQTGSEPVYNESWRERATLSETTSLVLKGLTKAHLGLFSCELWTEHETFFIHTQVTEETEGEGETSGLWIILVVSVLFLLLLLLFLLFLLFWRHRHKLQSARQRETWRLGTELEKRKRKEMEERMEMMKMKERMEMMKRMEMEERMEMMKRMEMEEIMKRKETEDVTLTFITDRRL